MQMPGAAVMMDGMRPLYWQMRERLYPKSDLQEDTTEGGPLFWEDAESKADLYSRTPPRTHPHSDLSLPQKAYYTKTKITHRKR